MFETAEMLALGPKSQDVASPIIPWDYDALPALIRPALPGPSHATGSWGTLSVSQNVSEIAGN